MMRPPFKPNLTRSGRWLRFALGLALAAAALASRGVPAACIGLALSSAFVLFEAARGWCVLRACGIKTKL